jgi:spore cortex biosynthesis protein YabQ
MYNFSQEQIFVFFFIIGIIIGIIFDIFRAIRKSFKTPDSITLIEDTIFLVISGLLLISSIIKLNNGEIRFYLFIAIFLGILIYSLTISKLCVIILCVIVETCKKILFIPISLMKKLIKQRKKANK